MDAADVIRGALELLPDEDAWARKTLKDSSGRHCVAGAILYASGGRFQAAFDLVAEEIRLEGGTPFGRWNDDPHTTFEDVRLVLKRALAKAEKHSDC